MWKKYLFLVLAFTDKYNFIIIIWSILIFSITTYLYFCKSRGKRPNENFKVKHQFAEIINENSLRNPNSDPYLWLNNFFKWLYFNNEIAKNINNYMADFLNSTSATTVCLCVLNNAN